MNSRLDALQTDDGRVDARKLNGGGPKHSPKVTPRECYRLRAALLRGYHAPTHATATTFGTTAAREHARGDCDHDVSLPPLRFVRSGFPTIGIWVSDE